MSPSGGIGRRDGLKIHYPLKMCRFESGLGHKASSIRSELFCFIHNGRLSLTLVCARGRFRTQVPLQTISRVRWRLPLPPTLSSCHLPCALETVSVHGSCLFCGHLQLASASYSSEPCEKSSSRPRSWIRAASSELLMIERRSCALITVMF